MNRRKSRRPSTRRMSVTAADTLASREIRTVRSSESLPFVYFLACAVLAGVRPLPLSRRGQIAALSVPTCAVIVATAHLANDTIRAWAPGLYILVGYYVSGRFFVRASPRLEGWLMSWDRRLLGDPTTRFTAWPRAVLAYLEIVYMGCFLLVPAGFAILAARGRFDLANRYWT